MSFAWETTPDDVRTVLDSHNVRFGDDQVNRLFGSLDLGKIEEAVLCYTDMDEQTAAMLSEIEDHLLRTGLVQGEKRFARP